MSLINCCHTILFSKMWLSRTALNGLIYPQKHISMCSKQWFWLLKKIYVCKENWWIWVPRAPRRGVLRPQIWYVHVTQKTSFRPGGFHSPVPRSAVNLFRELQHESNERKTSIGGTFLRETQKNWGSHRTKHLKLKQINKQKQTTNVDQFRLNVQLPTITYGALPALQVISWNRVWSICVAHFISKMWLREQPSTAWHIHKNTSWISLCSKIGKASWDLKFDIWMFSSSEVLTELHLLCKSLGHHVPYGRIWYRR